MVLVCAQIAFLMHVMKTNLTGDTGALNRAVYFFISLCDQGWGDRY